MRRLFEIVASNARQLFSRKIGIAQPSCLFNKQRELGEKIYQALENAALENSSKKVVVEKDTFDFGFGFVISVWYDGKVPWRAIDPSICIRICLQDQLKIIVQPAGAEPIPYDIDEKSVMSVIRKCRNDIIRGWAPHFPPHTHLLH
jgi:hypothetical protein